MAAKNARRYIVQGRVQGVGFRWFVDRKARDLKLTGWVRNLANGNVEVHAEGDEDSLEQLRSKLERGPLTARVESVSESPAAVEDHSIFTISE